ncbi:MAG: serine/threonine protein kinase [Deltaproteobacteria bacterium]|nr:serine/threonine protein kinase [Deltaproteobacteria bacterium]
MRSSETTVTVGDATVNALPAGARARRAQASHSPTPNQSMQLALATLREEEADSARTMIWVGRWIGFAALAALPFIGGSQTLRIVMAASVAFAIGVGFWVERLASRQGPAFSETALVLAISVSPGIFAAVLYFGIFSAVQLFPALAIYFFSRRESLTWSMALYTMNAIAQAVFGALVITHQLADPGLITSSQPMIVNTIGHVLLQLGFLGAFVLGRGSHKASRDAIARMQNAMQAAAQKEALLAEARQDLDRALAIDAPGRFTDQVFGDYRLGNVIGRGGMGEVYEAWHTGTGDVAAVKLLARSEIGEPHAVERFLREVRAVRGIDSPHVVKVLAASDEHAAAPYLVMERLQGQDLASVLRAGPITSEVLLTMLAQIGAALEQAWARGVVHRDLKPHNIFLCDDGTWKVLDFGVAALDDHSGTLTQGKVVGTPAYMAPEQARGEKVDHRADLYALAAIAYRWLTGRPVTGGKDLHAALYQTVHVMPQKPSTLAPLPDDVDSVLALALAKDPAARWPTAEELRAALATALEGTLDPRIRRRAADLLVAHPWGAVRG